MLLESAVGISHAQFRLQGFPYWGDEKGPSSQIFAYLPYLLMLFGKTGVISILSELSFVLSLSSWGKIFIYIFFSIIHIAITLYSTRK